MKLLKLHAHNVFSIGTIDLNLKDRGLVLVTGWSEDDKNGNMAGKSSVANRAIIWGLYGKTVDGIKADAVINTSIKNAKHCGVTIHFEGIDGETYRIYRARKPNSLVLSKKREGTYEVGSGTDPTWWEDLSKRNEKETQELIDKLLGRDHKTFIQSDFFGQGRERSFLALQGSEQRAVIEQILPLNSLDEWHEQAKSLVKTTEDKVTNGINNIHAQHQRVDMAKSHLDSLKSQHSEWLLDCRTRQAEAQNKLNKLQQISASVEEELECLKRSILAEYSVQENLDRYRAQQKEILSAINSLTYQIDTATQLIDRKASKPTDCISCGQPLPKEKIEELEVELNLTKLKREDLVRQRGEKEAQRYNVDAQIAICHEAQLLENKLKAREDEVRLKELVQELTGRTSPFDRLISSAEAELKMEIAQHNTYIKILEKEEEFLEHCLFWRNAFGNDLKTLMFDKVCPFLEDRTNQYLRNLGNGQIKVKFSTTKTLKSGDEKDEFCVTACSDTGSTVFELFSGAEKQLTSFAVGMALSDLAGMQTQGSSSFMILDEPFLYQSPENCERIINFITQHLGDKSTILLISNEDNLINLVPNHVHVVKDKGVSSIE